MLKFIKEKVIQKPHKCNGLDKLLIQEYMMIIAEIDKIFNSVPTMSKEKLNFMINDYRVRAKQLNTLAHKYCGGFEKESQEWLSRVISKTVSLKEFYNSNHKRDVNKIKFYIERYKEFRDIKILEQLLNYVENKYKLEAYPTNELTPDELALINCEPYYLLDNTIKYLGKFDGIALNSFTIIIIKDILERVISGDITLELDEGIEEKEKEVE